MQDNRYPTLKDVKAMQVDHGKLVAAEMNSRSNGMMMFSGVSDSYTLKEIDGEMVLLHLHKSDMDGTVEKLYRADREALDKIAQIADRENLYAWGEMRIDPEKDDRPRVFDYSRSSGIRLFTDDERGNTFSFNCDTAEFYGAGAVVKEITDILFSFVTDDGLISEKQSPPTDPRVIELKKLWFPDQKPTQEPTQVTDEPEKTTTQEFVYNGGDWKCPECGQDGNQGKFCANCGSWRPDLAQKKEEVKEVETQPIQPSEAAKQMGIPGGITEMMKTVGLMPVDKPDEQLAGLLEEKVSHGRIISFEHISRCGGMSINSHRENSTKAVWADGGAAVTKYIQQGSYDAVVTELKAGEKVIAELEQYIRDNNLTNLSRLTYDRSKDPFANMTDSWEGGGYSIVFDDSEEGGRSFVCFTLDPKAISQHGGGEITGKLSEFTQRLCSESVISSMRREAPKTGGMGMMGPAGTAVTVSTPDNKTSALTAQYTEQEKWECSQCGYAENTGKFCSSCGSPRK